MRRGPALAAKFVVLAVAALALGGCQGAAGADASASVTAADISVITVGAADSGEPTLSWPQGAIFPKAQTQLMWDGDGELVKDGQPLLLDLYVQDLSTGEVIKNTYSGLPVSRLMAPELLGDDLYRALQGTRVGARVLSVSPAVEGDDSEPAIAIVIDVLPDKAHGEIQIADPLLPRVTEAESTGVPSIMVDPGQELPGELSVSTLIKGDGAQISLGSTVLVQFVAVYATEGSQDGVSWHAGDIQQSTWAPEQAPFEGEIAEGKVIQAWLEGLIDVTSGSRVMIIAPEATAYPGKGTLVYVIDVLDVVSASGQDV